MDRSKFTQHSSEVSCLPGRATSLVPSYLSQANAAASYNSKAGWTLTSRLLHRGLLPDCANSQAVPAHRFSLLSTFFLSAPLAVASLLPFLTLARYPWQLGTPPNASGLSQIYIKCGQFGGFNPPSPTDRCFLENELQESVILEVSLGIRNQSTAIAPKVT